MKREYVNGWLRPTVREALTKIVVAHKVGRLAMSCMYLSRAGCKVCAVGALFTDDQLADISRRRLNSRTIEEVARRIGKKNIEFVSGLSLAQLKAIQHVNDNGGPAVAARKVQDILNGASTAINDVAFDLNGN